jgi:hypothetical protein
MSKLLLDELRGAQARDILLRMVANFPGLVLGAEEIEEINSQRDPDTQPMVDDEVNGADLVEWLTNELHHCRVHEHDRQLVQRAKHGTPDWYDPDCWTRQG